jgi:uncharacterized protein YceH (UPF0502 family)
MQLLGGEPEGDEAAAPAEPSASWTPAPAPPSVSGFTALEQRVAALERRVAALAQALGEEEDSGAKA